MATPVGPSRVGREPTRDGVAQLRHTTVDLGVTADEIVATSDFPGVSEWADFFVRHNASDVQAIETFGPRDGRSTAT